MSSKKIIIHDINVLSVTREGIKAYQIIEIGDLKFKLHANTSLSMVVGFDSDLCAKLITDKGLVNIVDGRSLSLPKNGSYARNADERRSKAVEVFEGLIKHLKELYA